MSRWLIIGAPCLTSPAMDARVDITDIYAFQKPGHPSKSILILNETISNARSE